MAERRYGFRFSFAEGCIIVASIIGASFLIFLFGVYAGRELEARKAAEHTSIVRLTALAEGETPNSRKEGQEKSTPVLQTPAPSVPDKLTTVVIVPSPRPSESANTAPAPVASSPTSPQEKTLAASPETGQKPQAAVASVQSAKTTPFISSSFPPVTHLATPDKTPTPPQGKEPDVKPDPSQKGQTNLVSPKAIPTPSVAPHVSVAEEKKQVVQVMQAIKREQALLLAKKPLLEQGRWSVQVQATRDEEGARQLAKALQSQGYAPTINRVVRDGEVWYRVRIGSFANSDEARASVERLRREGKFPQAYPVSN